MSYKRKTTSLSQSSGSDLSDAGKELELLANKKPKKSYAYTRYLKGKILFFFVCFLVMNPRPAQNLLADPSQDLGLDLIQELRGRDLPAGLG